MSLDVYLKGNSSEHKCHCPECGDDHIRIEVEELYHACVTHNLGKMAKEAGIYEALWRPKEIEIVKAKQLIGPLVKGLNRLRRYPLDYTLLNPSNGWGDYPGFLDFVVKYLAACEEHPEASVEANV